MPKIKENYTIDEDLSQWVRNFPKEFKSASDFVCSILREKMKSSSDPFRKVDNLDSKKIELEEQKEILLEEIKEISIQGNKQQREKAEKFLEEQKKRKVEEAKEMKEVIALLEEYNFISELRSCGDFEDFSNLRKKMMKQNPELFDKKNKIIFDISTLMRIKRFIDSALIPLEKQEAIAK